MNATAMTDTGETINLLRMIVKQTKDVTEKFNILSDVVDHTDMHSSLGITARNLCTDIVVKNPETKPDIIYALTMKSQQERDPEIKGNCENLVLDFLKNIRLGASPVIARHNSGLAYTTNQMGPQQLSNRHLLPANLIK